MSTVNALQDTEKLCIHSVTTKPWALDVAVKNYAEVGVKGITVWRDALGSLSHAQARDLIADFGLQTVSYCRGGFFPHAEVAGRQAAIDDNLKMIEEAHALGAPLIVLVCGAVPGMPLEDARSQIIEGIAAIEPQARAAGVKLGIEPLHPMYADSRSAVSTMRQANDIVESLRSPMVGVAADVYHIWWDPDLKQEIERCAALKGLFAFHICDWKTPTEDMLLDRGLMGEGCIHIRTIRSWVESAGFSGFNEVEIFSKTYWASDQRVFLERIVEAYLKHS